MSNLSLSLSLCLSPPPYPRSRRSCTGFCNGRIPLHDCGSLPPTQSVHTQLVLRSINTAKSAFFAVTFTAAFFDDYQPPDPSTLNPQLSTLNPEPLDLACLLRLRATAPTDKGTRGASFGARDMGRRWRNTPAAPRDSAP
eukprot:104519-Chlamydomonas_euryale.AAC.1